MVLLPTIMRSVCQCLAVHAGIAGPLLPLPLSLKRANHRAITPYYYRYAWAF